MCGQLDSQLSKSSGAQGLGRRSALIGALGVGGALAASAVLPAPSARAADTASASGDRLIMLGVGGGPVVNAAADAKPALALVVSNTTYLVDTGLDTARQLIAAGLTFASVRHAFITHHHFDHTSGLPGLVLHGWVGRPGLQALDVWGPSGVSSKVAGVRQTFDTDIRLFESGGGFPDFPRVRGHNVNVKKGPVATRVMEDANVVVDAARVYHGPEVKDAYAYRFTIKSSGKTIVFSGDTAAPNANLIALAAGCDVLVHECQDNAALAALVQGMPPAQAAALLKHMYEAHSNVLDLPAVAKAADVGRLVLSHYTPFVAPPQVWLGRAVPVAQRIGYGGQILAPRALEVITV